MGNYNCETTFIKEIGGKKKKKKKKGVMLSKPPVEYLSSIKSISKAQ